MKDLDVFQLVQKVMKPFCKFEIKQYHLFIEDLGMDSLIRADIFMQIENEFNVKFDIPTAINEIKKVEDLVKFLERHLNV